MLRIIFLFLVFFLISCEKTVETLDSTLTPLESTPIEKKVENWKPILLNSLEISEPIPINTSAFTQQLAQIHSLKQEIGPLEEEEVKYWAFGSIYRWNQILRQFIAKYNLAPKPNSDGTYPSPDENNPKNYPYYPYANPLYATRALAYLSAAQYDAMILSYQNKKKYNRLPAFTFDNSLATNQKNPTLPSYPCEEAAVAEVSYQLLLKFFPGEKEVLERHYARAKNIKIYQGIATPHDRDAGLFVGQKISEIYLQRADTDGMKTATATATQITELETNTKNRGDLPWKSLEIPARRPLLPFFSKVKPWNLTPENLNTIRPSAPPLVGSEAHTKELEEIKKMTSNATFEQIALVHYWADGVGGFSPVGHWNSILEKEISEANLSQAEAAQTFAFLNMGMMDAGIACWDAKFTYYNARPSTVDNSLKSWTSVPNFPAYVSGHSTFSAAAARILEVFFPAKKEYFNKLAKDASDSRLYGGLHYRSDCEKGLELGKKVGDFTVNRLNL